MSSIQASEIEYVDVVVVGGGIAGIAITEFLSRHSNLTIKVLEKSLKLGNVASGKLEGWFHTGALYSGQDDAQTFINCVNAVEDIINLYSPYFLETCNINLTEKSSNLHGPTIIPNSRGWFDDQPVHIIHPKTDAPEINSARLKSDAVQINIQLNKVLGRLEVAYGKQHNWKNGGSCIAPSYAQVENYEGIPCSLRQSTEVIRNLCSKFDNSYGISPSNYEVLQTLDCSMNTGRILRDLVASCLSQGVKFETGVTVDKLLMDRYGPIRLKSLTYKTKQGLPKRLKAKLFIFAVGEEFESLLVDLQVRSRLKRSRSAMIVAYPALVKNNFVRMSTKNRFHFNHFIQRREKNDQIFIYSMLANSGYIRDEEPEDIDIEPILESAERYFGKEKLYSHQLFSYECMKTEFISEEEQKRRYSYWIESNPKSNYLCVLPGKFSFFPTVAYQAYQRIKTLINFEESSPKIAFDSTSLEEIKKQAEILVADPYPLQVLRIR